MARTVLDNGVILPAEYSDDWYEDMTSNLTKLDDVIGSDAEKLSEGDVARVAMTGEYSDIDNTPDLSPYDTHIANSDIHVTSADKQKWNNGVSQSYVLRYSSTAITDNSTIAYSTLDNTDNIKVSDKIIDTNGKIFSIVSVDSANETVTVGSALIDLASDANVMHLSGDETAPGKKTFADLTTFNSWLYFTNSSVTKGTIPQSTVNPYRIYFGSGVNYGASLFNIDTSVSNTGVQTLTFRSAENVVSGDDARLMLIYDPNRAQPRYLSLKGDIEPNANNTYECGSSTNKLKNLHAYQGYFYGQQKGDEFSTNARSVLTLLANRDTLSKSCAYITRFRQNRVQGGMQPLDLQSISFDVVENEVRTNNVFSIQCTDWLNDVPQRVNIVCGAQSYSFGDSSNKALFNGLNPGALSFPDLSSGLDISSYLTNVGTTTPSEYTPTVNGWMCIGISADSPPALRVFNDSGFDAYSYTERNEIGSTSGGTYTRYASISVPVVGGVTYKIIAMPSTTSVITAKFFPCLGNV